VQKFAWFFPEKRWINGHPAAFRTIDARQLTEVVSKPDFFLKKYISGTLKPAVLFSNYFTVKQKNQASAALIIYYACHIFLGEAFGAAALWHYRH
jgi:hypothetical protein